MKKINVTPVINEESAARLEAKSYEKDWTEVPNRVLPGEVFTALNAIFTELSGGEALDKEGYTFTVRSQDGILKSILAPSVFRDADYSESGEATPKDNLVIRWGGSFFPLSLGETGFSFINANPKSKIKYSLRIEKVGKWDETVLNVAVTNSSAKEMYTFSFPVRSADWENKLDPDVAEVLLEDGKVADLLDYFQLKPNPNAKSSSGSSERLKGHFVKAGYFPVGDYPVTGYRVKTGGKFGPDYLIQVQIPEPFVAPVSMKDDETGEWVEREVEISDWAIMKPNTALKRVFSALPQVTPEQPGKIEVYDHSEYNGKPVAKVRVEVSSFEEKEGEIALNF